MSQDGKGDTSTLDILFLAGAMGIVIWFLTVVPGIALFFFVPIFGVLLLVVLLAKVVKDVVIWSLTGPTKNETELSEEEPSSKIDIE